MSTPAEKLKALNNHEFEFLKEKYPEYPSEFDTEMNSFNREKIRLFAEVHQNQKCYLGKVNRYSEDKGKPYLTAYDGQKIFNFEYGFMIPCYDEKLVEMVKERETAEYTGTKADYVRVSAIMDRIEELGGINLFWV